MKTVPVPIYNGAPVVIPPDEHSRRLRDGVKAGVLAGDRRMLEQQVRQLEKALPPSLKPKPTGRRQQASLTDAELWMISPHRATGARNSADDLRLIQSAHDALHDLGATCTVTPDGTTDVEDAQDPEDMHRGAYRSAPSRISRGRISRR